MTDQRPKTPKQPWLGIKPGGRLAKIDDVVERTKLSRSQIYSLIGEKRFPLMIKLSARASATPEVWLDACVEMQVIATSYTD